MSRADRTYVPGDADREYIEEIAPPLHPVLAAIESHRAHLLASLPGPS